MFLNRDNVVHMSRNLPSLVANLASGLCCREMQHLS